MRWHKHILLSIAIIVCLAVSACAAPAGQTSPVAPTPTFTQTQATPTPLPAGALVNLPSFANLVDAVKQSVVAINTEYVDGAGAGSGWIIDSNGTIVTNNHVIDGALSITVQLYDGSTYRPVSVKGNLVADIAVIKIDTGRPLPALRVADTSGLRVGDWVVIVGNALGLGISMKQGTISRLGVGISCP
jgi:S1-C subfamily serine protease